jgi:SAM-dependent MidA family methyltransferase
VAVRAALVERGALPVGARFALCELGPGRGTLAADALRALARFAEPRAALAALHLVESSGVLRAEQARALHCDMLEREGEREREGEGKGEAGAAAGAGGAGAGADADPASPSPPISSAAAPSAPLAVGIVGARGALPGLRVEWHASLAGVPAEATRAGAGAGAGAPLPTFFIAHEFFDALPVHQLVWAGAAAGWRERLVDIAPDAEAAAGSEGGSEGGGMGGGAASAAAADPPTEAALPATREGVAMGSGASAGTRRRFRVVRAQGPTAASVAFTAHEAALAAASGAPVAPRAEGDVAEYCPEAVKLAHALAQRVGAGGGAALIVDYSAGAALGAGEEEEGGGGGEGAAAAGGAGAGAGAGASGGSRTWSLRGIRRHAFVDPLSDPGRVDLSCDVDFASLAFAARGSGVARAHGPASQGAFLARMGLRARLERLLRAAEGDGERARLVSEARRLVERGQMGAVYKVMALLPGRGGGGGGGGEGGGEAEAEAEGEGESEAARAARGLVPPGFAA